MSLLANLRKTLAERLAYLRAQRGWKQHDLAAEARISVDTLRNWEQQRRWPDPEDIEKLAHVLNVRPVDLLFPENERPKPSPLEALEILREAIDPFALAPEALPAAVRALIPRLVQVAANEREWRVLLATLSGLEQGRELGAKPTAKRGHSS
jgi:transcriptional regulator with XRE-family HTH domain